MGFLFIEIMLILSVLWLIILSYYIYRLIKHYNNLTGGVNHKNLEHVLDKLHKDIYIAQKNIAQIISRCDTIEKNESNHIQRISLLRFNPFKDTGGDQSFILTLRDAHDTGVVITGLHSRSGLRWYIKKIIEGKGIEHELSDEEKNALKDGGIINYAKKIN